MSQPEVFSRVLIDRSLAESGWDLLDSRQVRFELHGHSGQADYVLSGQHGPLCVLEAKRPELDPYDAKEQARGYAENLKAPFIILSNGTVHYFWNYARTGRGICGTGRRRLACDYGCDALLLTRFTRPGRSP